MLFSVFVSCFTFVRTFFFSHFAVCLSLVPTALIFASVCVLVFALVVVAVAVVDVVVVVVVSHHPDNRRNM